MSYQINELERQLSEARTRISGLEIERDGAYSLLREAADEHTALRAELDSLRETLAQKIETTVLPIDHTKTVTVVDVQRQCAAIVRGSDDDA